MHPRHYVRHLSPPFSPGVDPKTRNRPESNDASRLKAWHITVLIRVCAPVVPHYRAMLARVRVFTYGKFNCSAAISDMQL